MTSTEDRASAGWYADPSGEPMWRYWDGNEWTEHRAPASFEQSPAAALAEEQRWARFARWAFVAYVPLVAAMGVLGALYFDQVYSGTLFDADPTASDADAFGAVAYILGYQACALVAVGVLFVLAFWCYKAAKTARAAGIPIRREPGMALASWFIPIVNLWWPPQTIRSFSPDPQQLRVVVEWWVCWIVTNVALVSSLFAAGASSFDTAIPFIAVAVVGAVAYAILGFHVVRLVLAVHDQVLEERHLRGE